MTHNDLVQRAEHWLWKQNCGVVFNDKFKALTQTGESPDALGFRHNVSILIECKSSRADFLVDKNKPFRKDPAQGLGDWRFYLCPPGVIQIEDLPAGWGLLYATDKQIQKVHGIPTNAQWNSKKPFSGNKEAEIQCMYSALRRLTIRGYLPQIYEGVLVKR